MPGPFEIPDPNNPSDQPFLEPIESEDLKARFRSQIPTHLLVTMNEHEKYLFNICSTMHQENQWLIEQTKKQNRMLIELWKRQNSGNIWLIVFKSKWSIFAWVATIGIAAAANEFIRNWLRGP